MMGHSSDSGSALTASVVDGNRCDDGDGGEGMVMMMVMAMVEVEEDYYDDDDDDDDGKIEDMSDLQQ